MDSISRSPVTATPANRTAGGRRCLRRRRLVRMLRRPTPRAALVASMAAAITVVLWASAFVAIRAIGTELSAGPLALGRLLLGGAALGVLVAVRREGLPPRQTVPGIAACGVLWFAAYNVLLNAGSQLVDAGTASMLVNVGPLFIAVLAGSFLDEGFPRSLLGGAVLAFLGAVVIATGGRGSSELPAAGVALGLAAAAAYAAGVVIQKPLLRSASPLQVTWLACVAGAVACLPFAPTLYEELRTVGDVAVVWWLVFLGLLPTAVGFTTWAYALRHTTAGRLGATTYLVPPITVVISWLVLSEVPPPASVVGGTVCLIGVAVARRRRDPRARCQ